MATYAITDTQLTAIADAIRLKRDTAEHFEVDDMPLAISLIDGNGSDVTTGTITGSGERKIKIATGKSGIKKFVLVRSDFDGQAGTFDSAYKTIFVEIEKNKYNICVAINYAGTTLTSGNVDFPNASLTKPFDDYVFSQKCYDIDEDGNVYICALNAGGAAAPLSNGYTYNWYAW